MTASKQGHHAWAFLFLPAYIIFSETLHSPLHLHIVTDPSSSRAYRAYGVHIPTFPSGIVPPCISI